MTFAFDWTGAGALTIYVIASIVAVLAFLEYLNRGARYALSRRSRSESAPSGAMTTSGTPRLDTQVRGRERHQHILDIRNTGDLPIEEIGLELPDVPNWQFFTDVLPSYPIRVLEPGDTASIPFVVTMGGPVAIDVVLRGRAAGEAYERSRTVSVYSG